MKDREKATRRPLSVIARMSWVSDNSWLDRIITQMRGYVNEHGYQAI